MGDKLGSFAKGLALPTMERLLRRRFHMAIVSPRSRIRKDGQEREYEALAWAHGKVNTVVVDVKSRVKREAIAQLIEQLKTLFDMSLLVPKRRQAAR
ncbi:hypothetical protein Talka_02305 [Tepidimonas alkaliphilus]|uniref:Uncharacterized protein n=1 Tax=Tepidimonas alkaliphilus TaxID=2588942 RepID=A0A554W3Q7_9BURK|nr:hypothetical protein [Tepidimonas alkaliphilus]TSE18214.1 hypothetical protein Talka_02305 [Tepidimonas alkaliphilus]